MSSKPTATRQPISPDQQLYRVQAGDTLSGIAWRSQHSLRHIAHLNNLHPPYIIRIGQVLRLRSSSPSSSSSPPKPRAPAPPPKPAIRSSLTWAWPVSGPLFSTFKAGDTVRKGIKIAIKPGSPVRASESGRVVYSGNGLIGYGPLIIIKHNDNFLSAYGHNRKLLVETGQQVNKGQTIANSGSANSGKPLLHFEIRLKGKPVNPLRLLPPR